MKEEMKAFLLNLLKEHPKGISGLALGFLLGAAILIFGFWNMLFILLLGAIGLGVGMKLDKGESFTDTFEGIRKKTSFHQGSRSAEL